MLELDMHEAHVLRREGHQISTIAQVIGKSERTVYYYLSGKPRQRKKRIYPSKLDPFKPYIKSLLEDEPDFNREVIFERLKGMGYTGGITILRDCATQISKEINQQAVIRFETEPGRQAQVDWKVHGIKTVDGKKQRLYAFAMVFGYSRAPFVIHTTSMDQNTLHACHVAAFDYFGGVPHEILYDNMKTAFIRDRDGRWRVNKNLMQLANHYGFVPKRCRVRRPQTKGKVERFIDYYSQNFWTSMKGSPLTLDTLNEAVLKWISQINEKRIGGMIENRSERFSKDKDQLIPLPLQPFDCRREQRVTVSRESLILYKTNSYSVPPRYIGKEISLWIDPFLPIAQVYGSDGFIRDIELALEAKCQRYYREEDRTALYDLWLKQQLNKKNPTFPKTEIDVSTGTPSFYEKLISSWGVA
jgi:transposase